MDKSKLKLTLRAHFISQPSRSVWTFLTMNKIPFEFIQLDLDKAEHKSPEYLKMNPHGTVPSLEIKYGEHTSYINESTSIVRFLAEVFEIEKLYPTKDIKRQALVNQYLDWHHTNTRRFCFSTVWTEFAKPMMESKLGMQLPPSVSYRDQLPAFLDGIQKKLSEHEYIVDNEMSAADIFLYQELAGLFAVNWDFSTHPKIEAFIKKFSKCSVTKESLALWNGILTQAGLKLVPFDE